MRLADSLGFLFTQKELIEKSGGLRVDPDINLDLIHCTSAPPFVRTINDILREHTWLLDTLAKQDSPPIRFVTQGEALTQDGLKVVFGLQHPPEDDKLGVDELAAFPQLGIFFMSLAYEMESVYGGGFAVPDAPLTDRGRQLLEDMARVGMILDLSHVGHQTAREALAYINSRGFTLPVVATHSGCYGVYPHLRNLPDDILEGIADLGGCVGIPACTFMLDAADNTFRPFRKHVQHAVNRIGPDAVGVGSDGIYKRLDLQQARSLFGMMKAKIDPHGNFGARFPDQPESLNTPLRMAVITGALRGVIPTRVIKNVCGRNFFAFLGRHI